MIRPYLLCDWNSTGQNQKAGIITHIKSTYNYTLQDSDFAEWDIDLSAKIGISRGEWDNVWSNEAIFRTAPAYPYFREAMRKLSAKYRIIILTSCACGPDVCRAWFVQNDIPFSEVIWTQNKCAFGGLLIDDSPSVLKARYEQSLMTVAFSQPWNSEFDKFPKLHGWQQVAAA